MALIKVLGRVGTLFSVLAIVAMTAGCPFNNDPCNGFDVADDDDPCTTDTCDVVDGEATSVHTAIADCCEAASDCADDDACTIDVCANINSTTGAGTCTNTAVGQNCCNDNDDCDDGEVCVGNLCIGA